ncbi:MAG: 7-cyano-7-deazaguanine synthase QueC [Bacteroidales bacterium]|jgi:7-cyano-7-deazaguanine synthase|nr:7-cyano-7-deazaguanine synthase QueC [Bacteroidales bacterium]
MKRLIVYSGGMDSTVLLHQFAKEIGMAVSFHYGSKHNDREIAYAKENCSALGIEHRIIRLDFINEHFKSNLLLSGGDIPDGHYHSRTMKSTVVPFRNGVMLSIAVGIAESHGLDAVFIASHGGDHAIYPDCREHFMSLFHQAALAGTYASVSVIAPYSRLNKRTIALMGKRMKVDFSKTYSCYKGGEHHCGTCGTCTERREALAGFDSTLYEN